MFRGAQAPPRITLTGCGSASLGQSRGREAGGATYLTQVVSSRALRGLLLFIVSLVVLSPAPAYAWWSSLSKVGRAGKLGSTAGKVRIASAASKLRPALLAGGAALAAERATLAFASAGDDVGRVTSYLARESDGTFRVVRRDGAQSTHRPETLSLALASPSGAGSDVLVELNAARTSGELPAPRAGDHWFALDGEGVAHPLHAEQSPQGTRWWVDVGDKTIELADFATAALDGEEASLSPAKVWIFRGINLAVWVLLVRWGIGRWRRRQQLRPS